MTGVGLMADAAGNSAPLTCGTGIWSPGLLIKICSAAHDASISPHRRLPRAPSLVRNPGKHEGPHAFGPSHDGRHHERSALRALARKHHHRGLSHPRHRRARPENRARGLLVARCGHDRSLSSRAFRRPGHPPLERHDAPASSGSACRRKRRTLGRLHHCRLLGGSNSSAVHGASFAPSFDCGRNEGGNPLRRARGRDHSSYGGGRSAGRHPHGRSSGDSPSRRIPSCGRLVPH